MKNKICLWVVPLLLSACSTVPISAPKINGPAIIFTRDTGFVGSGCTFNLIVDGDTIGLLSAGKVVVKIVANGRHKVAIENGTATCPDIRMTKVLEVIGEPIVLRVGITSNFQVIFDQTD